jgi:hypothetical protein
MTASRLIDRLANAIACQEGWFDPIVDGKENRPQQLNNPGDIEYAGQYAATRDTATGFAKWPTPEAGILGLYRDLYAKIQTGMSLQTLINTWAPPTGNNTAVYLSNVQKWTGVLGAAVDVPLVTMIEQLQDPRV